MPHFDAKLARTSLAIGSASAAAAQEAERTVENPRTLNDSNQPASKMLLSVAPDATRPAPSPTVRERVLNLNVVMTDGQLYNPATGLNDKVRLRSYNGTDVDPTKPYVSPTIEIRPGETIRVNLDNQLPADPGCMMSDHMPDKPHCFNGTNLHTHGLWVNPAGNGDNVLLSINPGVKFQYEYNVPGEHPSGTFWYHTHRHGSTALQVSSGMAGALIIRGDRLPTLKSNGDLDTIIAGMPERILVMQQIQYACRTAPSPGHPHGTIKQTIKGRYLCDPGDVGVIEDYDQFGPGTWPASGRYTSLNGEVLPSFNAVQGQVERWRMIHAGVRDTISLQFFRAKPGKLAKKLQLIKSPEDEEKAIRDNCGTEALPYSVVAADGLTMAAGQQTKLTTFQPGYRYDALVVFPDTAGYCVIDSAAPKSGTVNALAVSRQLLGFVKVAPGTKVTGNLADYVTNALVQTATKVMPADVQPSVVADLKAGMKLTRFVPHPTIEASEVTGTQELTFFIDTKTADTKFEVGNTLVTADAKSYDPNRLDRALKLGGVDEWTMQSHFVSHPFHIHVNPFQIVSIIDPNGKDVSAIGSVDDAGGDIDPQYAGLKGVWKDTLWIKSLIGGGNPSLPEGFSGLYTIKVRTRYERYIGEFVLHCHILDHEDQGMMQNVAVVLPDGNVGAPANAPLQLQGNAHGNH
ncbi:multicopper oxidase family protein [Sphingomonas sp. ERG5]|uniref:multicopper oxidase family protein n=1 Tax=Sphingomonas sp. ERG5 TaxID=1381597 RepID=UPI00068E81BF|nr:multicopper oxidase family protein [Sphingomonas sp. ERG5]